MAQTRFANGVNPFTQEQKDEAPAGFTIVDGIPWNTYRQRSKYHVLFEAMRPMQAIECESKLVNGLAKSMADWIKMKHLDDKYYAKASRRMGEKMGYVQFAPVSIRNDLLSTAKRQRDAKAKAAKK